MRSFLVKLLDDHDSLALIWVVLAREWVWSCLDAYGGQRFIQGLAVIWVDVQAASRVWHVNALVPTWPVACQSQGKATRRAKHMSVFSGEHSRQGKHKIGRAHV